MDLHGCRLRFMLSGDHSKIALSMRIKKIQSLRGIVSLLGTVINRRTPCDLMNSTLDHILTVGARVNLMVLFLSVTLCVLRALPPGTSYRQQPWEWEGIGRGPSSPIQWQQAADPPWCRGRFFNIQEKGHTASPESILHYFLSGQGFKGM